MESTDQEVLYDRSSSSRPFKRVRFDTVAVDVLPELVPNLPQAVVACVAEDLQDNSEIVVNPFYLQMWDYIVKTLEWEIIILKLNLSVI